MRSFLYGETYLRPLHLFGQKAKVQESIVDEPAIEGEDAEVSFLWLSPYVGHGRRRRTYA